MNRIFKFIVFPFSKIVLVIFVQFWRQNINIRILTVQASIIIKNMIFWWFDWIIIGFKFVDKIGVNMYTWSEIKLLSLLFCRVNSWKLLINLGFTQPVIYFHVIFLRFIIIIIFLFQFFALLVWCSRCSAVHFPLALLGLFIN